ncbi:MAG: hypothetical protein A3C85_03115 [Candidatus Doudnabacteria bacterium RIFCSPHIGHO2_02_FULL_48_21]|uniref:Type II secretion system protein GspG C-terminal domain-containing protein n=1 Tax=Candidatus Doudnabacteria bacterium RIFCSPLOWO2_02_FULL_48_13 TaxID=1817845 RepID=A0A1F5QBZ3_9BACT|nr:MAG: hypothetical protein A3K05_00375 [Candidatus Doudnabacteria bacterium RIFCSPHIGHO2_01_48_18]OGE91636.1 MAG: hypothetical protein A3F44_02945 [Candidatus Doudnabacteria bacterium RIFCSPHIGHO2_12_FULL_47_25]OGE93250.1 MAG: hypothetical protein A3C85_03115 [Candidatus Doudnabacteria bacterium RIFCSPHIGHO2_02_FULL_48_21]OGE99733.1 MAG: hypothetical protein A3J05_01875 [Candidatus Doudnabacteria bacterium RIFCSPLOWO2_02_FULL_48_13]OGF01967.1 MAG: hypothetical protein A3G07_02865 [Candidatus 
MKQKKSIPYPLNPKRYPGFTQAPAFSKSGAGFTLIELLVVVAIIGLMASILTIGLTEQRRRARDAKRISDLKQIKSGMDIFFDNASGYPNVSGWVTGSTLSCGPIQILYIPADPGAPVHNYQYAHTGGPVTGCGFNNLGRAYTLTFFMERINGFYIMDEDGVVRSQATGDVVSVDSLL